MGDSGVVKLGLFRVEQRELFQGTAFPEGYSQQILSEPTRVTPSWFPCLLILHKVELFIPWKIQIGDLFRALQAVDVKDSACLRRHSCSDQALLSLYARGNSSPTTMPL